MRYTSGKYGATLKKDWGGALTGASSGAKMGAGLGTMFGPVGSIVGGAIGAIGGALFGNRKENKLRRQQKAQDAAIAKLKEEEKVRTENLRLKQLNLNDTAYLSNFKLNEQSSLFMKNGGWIQKANASIKRRGTEGVCSGSNFGGPSCRPGTKRYALAKTFKKMAKNKEDGGTVEEKSINIKDKRTIDAVTGKLVNSKNRFHAKVDSDYVKQVVSSAKKHGVDPSTALAINMAETRFNPEHMTNPFMLGNYDPYGNIIDESMKFISSKQKYAKKLGKTTDEHIIQAYNGYGTIKNKGKLYGINTDSTEINMSKTPLYGKRVVNLRDSVLRTNPQIMSIVNKFKKNGGKIGNKPNYTGMGIGFMNTTHPEEWNSKLGLIKQRMYNNIYPFNYQNMFPRVLGAAILNKKDPLRKKLDDVINNKDRILSEREMSGLNKYPLTARKDAFNFYMGKPQEHNTFSNSKYRPSNSKDKKAKYYSLNDPTLKERILRSYPGKPAEAVMGNYKVDKGKDEKGEYISYYDKWDIDPIDFGKPFEIYDRIYLNKANGGKLATTGINLKGGNKLITNRNGGTSGTHESGQNIPIKKNGKTLAIAEPGEVLVNDKDIYDVPFVLSKKLGFAQDFMELESIKNVYNKDVIEDKQNKLVVMNNRLTDKGKRAANGIALSPILSKPAPSRFKLQGTNNPYKPSMSKRSGSFLGDLKTNFTGFDANTVFGAVGTLGNMIMSNKAIKRQKGLIQNSLTEALNYNPILNKNYLLNDVVDINDQISETNQNYNSSVSGLSGIDPAIAGAIKSSASLNKSRSVGAILANRRNMQAGIRNQNTMNIAQNNASNNAVLNETALMKLNAKIAANEQLGEAENARLANTQGAISEFNTILRDRDIMKSLDARWKDSIGQDYTGKKLKCGGKVGKRRKHSMAY